MMKSFISEKLSNAISFTGERDKGTYTKEEARRVRLKYPERVPIIVRRSSNAGQEAPMIDKNKFLVPSDLTMGQFQYVIRKRLSLAPEKALFLFVNNSVPPTSMLVSTIYEESKDLETDFLYIYYSMENTFGN